jgi:hypothetical protein
MPARAPSPTALTLSLSKGVATRLRRAQPERGGTGVRIFAVIAAAATLSACASQVASGVDPAAPGFFWGVWHGFIFPVAWGLSLFVADIAIYSVPNNGGWYDFGYFIGVVFLGVGARSSRTVYRTRVVERPARRGTVIENER